MIENADYVINLGTGAGDRVGYVVAIGTPEEVSQVRASATGQYLGRISHKDTEYALLR